MGFSKIWVHGESTEVGAATITLELLAKATGFRGEVNFHGGTADVRLPSLGRWELEWVVLRENEVGVRRLDLGRVPQIFEVRSGSWRELIRPSFPTAAYLDKLGG